MSKSWSRESSAANDSLNSDRLKNHQNSFENLGLESLELSVFSARRNESDQSGSCLKQAGVCPSPPRIFGSIEFRLQKIFANL